MPKESVLQRGFTLIELMVVVAIIAAIAAFAIPNMLASRKAANESRAIQNLKKLSSAQVLYQTRDLDNDGRENFAVTFADLLAHGLIDEPLADGQAGGYAYELVEGEGRMSWLCYAVPLNPQSGDRSFLVDESGVVRYSIGAAPTASDPPVGG